MSHQIKTILEDTDSDKELKKEWQEQSELGKPRSKKARVKPRAETVADCKQNMSGFMNKEEKCSAELLA